MKILILGFYGVGKTTALKDYPNAVDLTDVLDHTIDEQPSLERFYQYWNDDKYEIVMADPWWTRVLLQSGIPFYTVIPESNRKEEFFKNFKKRHALGIGGGDDEFCELVDKCWDGLMWAYRCLIPYKDIIILKEDQWMNDAIKIIREKN